MKTAKDVLFVCIENSCRSQMAEGFASRYGKGVLNACSAGSKPAQKVENLAVEVMLEAGVDISRAKPKGFKQLLKDKFDYVVTMGCGDRCPVASAGHFKHWDIEDPKGKPKDVFFRVRDEIERKIKSFIDTLNDSAENNKEG